MDPVQYVGMITLSLCLLSKGAQLTNGRPAGGGAKLLRGPAGGGAALLPPGPPGPQRGEQERKAAEKPGDDGDPAGTSPQHHQSW